MIDIQRVFPGADELGVGLRRDDPLLLQPGLEEVFLSVRRTPLARKHSRRLWLERGFTSKTAPFED